MSKTPIRDITDYLEGIAPLHLQEEYDNAGLLTGDAEQVCTGVMIALDATPEVIEEAHQKRCNMVVAHHPIVFHGLKQITGRSYVERAVIHAIKNDIAIYAIHTNLDNVLDNGVNGMIADKLELSNRQVLRPKENGHPVNTGAGLIGKLPQPMAELTFLEHLKKQMELRMIRHTGNCDQDIETVALCGGSGSFLLNDAIESGAQVFITADFKYHEFFDADHHLMICDIGHYESERFTIDLLQRLISSKFSNFAVLFTGINTNPINYYI